MKTPDFSKPSNDTFLTVDKNGTKLKAGDVLYSNSMPLRGTEPVKEQLAPVEKYEGNLISLLPLYSSRRFRSKIIEHSINSSNIINYFSHTGNFCIRKQNTHALISVWIWPNYLVYKKY